MSCSVGAAAYSLLLPLLGSWQIISAEIKDGI